MFTWQRKFGSEADPIEFTQYLQEQYPPIHPIPLDFEEGQEVTLLRGAKVGGLTTKCNQPGQIVHIQYSDEFGLTYVVRFGSLGMYAYVGADGLEAVAQEVAPVTPLLDLYPGVDEGDFLPALLEDAIEYIEAGDLIRWEIPGMVEAREGVVVHTMPTLEFCLVEFQYGTRRSCHIDEIQLVLKASAWETKALASVKEVSAS